MEVSIGKQRRTYSQNYVRSLFDGIAHRYDFLNHLLSGGIDRYWRRKAVELLAPYHPQRILDVATGTGDFALQVLKLRPQSVTGIDISTEMLKRAQLKAQQRAISHTLSFIQASVEQLPFNDNSFDAALVAFGVRNFENLEQGLKEIHRVLTLNGVLIVLEFSQPQHFPIKQLYRFYLHKLIPVVGKFFSNHSEAYRYLPTTIDEFPYGNNFCTVLNNVGFQQATFYPLTFGIVTIYTARKLQL